MRDDRLSDLFDRCGNSFLYRWNPDGEGYEVNGDCNICINGKLPSYSASCVECGLLRKNYKPMTNADRIRGMDDVGLAAWYCHDRDCRGCEFGASDGCHILDWLKAPVKEIDE